MRGATPSIPLNHLNVGEDGKCATVILISPMDKLVSILFMDLP